MSHEGQEDQMEMSTDNDQSKLIPPIIPPRIHPRGTVIVSVTPGDRSSPDDLHSNEGTENSYYPLSFSPTFTDLHGNQRLLMAKHLQVRQSLSEPSKARIVRQKPHRMSPIPKRHDIALAKTLSVGGGLDGSSSPSIMGWKVGGDSPGPHSPVTMDSTHSSNESLNTISSDHDNHMPNPPGSFSLTKMSSFGGSSLQTSPAWVLPSVSSSTASPLSVAAGVIPSQEQLETLHQKQLEMLALLEQQKNMMTSSGIKPEMFQFPIALWPVATSNLLTTPSVTSTTVSTNPTPSPTPSSDSGFHTITTAPESITLPQHRPLGGTQSAPHGLQQTMTDSQYEALLKQFQVQHQNILLQQQSLYQHYLDQQNKLMQQAMLEKKHFEDQQRQLTTLHLQQQQQLQRQQSLLRQMQEQQVHQLHRQQQIIILQTLGIQQQHQASVNAKTKHGGIRGNLPDKPDHHSPTLIGGGMDVEGGVTHGNGAHRSLSSTSSMDDTSMTNGRSSSPSVAGSVCPSNQNSSYKGTGLIYDTMMLKHNCGCGSSHAEHPGRLQSIWARLMETGLIQKCVRLRARKASLAELQTVHSENHVKLYGRPNKLKISQDKKDVSGMRAFVQLTCGGVGVDNDTYWNDQHTSNAARMAVGSLMELADRIVNGEISNGLALVRPPGHHALPNQAMAFCYFNNVALTARALIAKNKRVAIVDWDIHHGNGTQQIFYDSPAVLFISIHRHDNGTFFPGTGRPEEIGSGAGMGYNVNIAFSGKPAGFQGPPVSSFGDPEYLAAFRSVVLPILREFNADIVLVSSGFNSTSGHPATLGGYNVTPRCYGHLTRMLMNCGNGNVALALEGGYELMSLCESAEYCMKCLVGDGLPPLDYPLLNRPPQPAAVASIEKIISCHKSYWPSLQQSSHILNMSHIDAEKCDDTLAALASLSVNNNNNNNNGETDTHRVLIGNSPPS